MSDAGKTFLFRNKRVKLIAFLLAAVTWYVVHEAISHEYELIDVPITVSLTPGWAVLERSAETVSIRFRGSREDIRGLKAESVQMILDLRGEEQKGARTHVLRPQDVKAPGNARPLSFRPAEVVFTLDKEGEKSVPVKADLTGELPPGIETESVVIRPATVRLIGPETLLEGYREIRTEPLALASRTSSFKERVGLVLPGSGEEIRLDPGKVTVEMELVKRTAEVEFSEVPIRALLPQGVTPQIAFDPPLVKVVLVGQPEELAKVQKQSLLAFVDCSGINVTADYELPVRIDVPQRVSVQEVTPAVIQVRVDQL